MTDEQIQQETQEQQVEIDEPTEQSVEEAEPETVDEGQEQAGDEEDSSENETFRQVRSAHRRVAKENKKLRAQLEQLQNAGKPQQAPKKPTPEQFDYDYDEYDKALNKYYQNEARHASELAAHQARQQQEQQAWQARVANYNSEKARLNDEDYQEAEDFVSDTLNNAQQGILLQYTKNPAKIVSALGRNPNKAFELAAIDDPISFALAVQNMEVEAQVKRKAPPAPERTVNTAGPKSGIVDNTLDRLRKDAEKTGDYSKVMRYKEQKRRASR